MQDNSHCGFSDPVAKKIFTLLPGLPDVKLSFPLKTLFPFKNSLSLSKKIITEKIGPLTIFAQSACL